MQEQSIPCKGYSIHVAASVDVIAARILEVAPASSYVLVTDTNVGPLYAHRVRQGLENLSQKVHSVTVEAGEASKDRAVKEWVEDQLLQLRLDRAACVVALGGGVVGDLSGFVAATYMRGIAFVQVPTTVLAMVDSSIGGKTGVDTRHGKNLVGAFHQPRGVFVCSEFLKTLPRRELCNGMAEVIKVAATSDAELFRLLEQHPGDVLSLNTDILTRVMRRAAGIKAEIVVADEKERGIRSILNFGHSVGHAVEALRQEEPNRLLHGECVAMGMVAEARLSRGLGYLSSSSDAVRRIICVLKAYKLPVELPSELGVDALLEKMSIDKKNAGGEKRLVMVTGIGSVRMPYTTPVSDDHLKILLCASASLMPSPPVQGRIRVPGSKSISNRVLLLAALGKGTCRIHGLLQSDDTQVMLASLSRIGVHFSWEGDVLRMDGSEGRLVPHRESDGRVRLYVSNAGTASRFLTSVVTLVEGGDVELSGSARMHERPIGDLVDALRTCGSAVQYLGDKPSLPVLVPSDAALRGGRIPLRADTSSQFVSSLLMTSPYAQNAVTLSIQDGKLVSPLYVDMTVRLMREFGVDVVQSDAFTFLVPQGVYQNPAEFYVEGDASSATYPLALAAVTGGKVTVDNVGSASLQGDAKFAHLLGAMGCTVTQTETETTVQGPGEGECLRAVDGDVDMGDMTDAFMTMCAVAAVARGNTRIRNIENQRVKECNRIQAMVTELTKCGVEVRELSDGIEVIGLCLPPGPSPSPNSTNAHQALIHCYKDHRIAMSFAVLGARLANVVMLDKGCVDKTYPSFWDDIAIHLGIRLDPAVHRVVEPASVDVARVPSTLVIIGMRGAGKTTLGKVAAAQLGWRFVDVDEELERVELAGGIKEFIEEKGWEAFRAKELQAMKRLHKQSQQERLVIACGGGLVETKECRTLLHSWRTTACVVQMRRDIDDIEQYLLADGSRPAFAQRPLNKWLHRKEWYAECSDWDFQVAKGDEQWRLIERDFCRFLRRLPLCSVDSVAHADGFSHQVGRPVHGLGLPCDAASFFGCLTFGRMESCLTLLPEIEKGVDALELRVDLMDRPSDAEWLGEQLALLRRHCTKPVIFTVRTTPEGGRWDTEKEDGEEGLKRVLRCGLKHGVEFVDVESRWSDAVKQFVFAHPGSSKVIHSYHDTSSNGGSHAELQRLVSRLSMGGSPHVSMVKLVVTAQHHDDGLRMASLARRCREAGCVSEHQGLICLAMGEAGRLSRVLNQCLSPVTHSLLPSSAAPGQMSARAIQECRLQMGWLHPKKYYLFGSPIGLSPSPTLHHTVFTHLSLPHTYSLHECTSLADMVPLLEDPLFGGASVTMPLKQTVLSSGLLQHVSDAVRKIGAVNTIVKCADGQLHGHNTDWHGIYRCLHHHVTASPVSSFALVVGAGGTARAALFALQQLGFEGERLVVFNPRTSDKAHALAREFGCVAVDHLQSHAGVNGASRTLPCDVPLACIVSTLPPTAAFQMPREVLTGRPVVMDVTYLPKESALLEMAVQCGCRVARGIDMLVMQGLAQAALWTGRAIPEEAVREAVMGFYENV